MSTSTCRRVVQIAAAVLLSCQISVFGQELQPIQLLPPQLDSGKLLMQALNERKTSRAFSSEKLSLQQLSNLLWAAFGINRPESGKRTAPSAMNWQETDIYVAMQEGLFLYDAKNNMLQPVLAQDIRGATGMQDFVQVAPVSLVYVADMAKTGNRASEEDKALWSAAATGFIAQNVYLYCASEGLATVIRGMVDKSSLAEVLGLRPEQKIMLSQTVGYPKK